MLAGALLSAGFALPAHAAPIVIADAASQPESLTVGPGGDLFVASAGSPRIYRVRKGTNRTEPFVDAKADGATSFFFGVLADEVAGTLWACQLTPVPGTTPLQRRSRVLGFDLKTGRETFRWELPGDNSMCNDFALGPDRALYVTDTANARIFRLAQGDRTPEPFLENRLLSGVNGIAWLGDGLFVTNIAFNKLYRIPVDGAGTAGAPVDIWMDAPVIGPDGLRAADGRLFIGVGRQGQVIAVTVEGEIGHVERLREGLANPTGVAVSGDTVWFTERGAGTISSVPLAPHRH